MGVLMLLCSQMKSSNAANLAAGSVNCHVYRGAVVKTVSPGVSAVLAFNPLQHKYVVYTEGNVYSFRLTTHFICGNVLIAHPMRFDGMASLMMEENKNWIIADPEW